LDFFLQPVSVLVNAMGINVDIISGATVIIQRNSDYIIFNAYWECIGIFSILIYSIIFFSFLIKTRIKNKVKAYIFVLGAFGTFLMNQLRIFLILYYYYSFGAQSNIFHSIIGELLFFTWILILIIITSYYIESN